MVSSEGREQPVIFWAVLTALCRALLSAAVHPEYHTVIQYVRMLSTVALWNITSSFFSRLFLPGTLRKWSRCWAFFTTAAVQERLSVTWTPRNLKERTLSTHSPLMDNGAGSGIISVLRSCLELEKNKTILELINTFFFLFLSQFFFEMQ